MLPALVAVLFSSSVRLSVGPTALLAFTQGAPILIIGSQLPAILGSDPGWTAWVAHPRVVHLPTLAFGLGAAAVLQVARRWRPGFPSVLLLVIKLVSFLGTASSAKVDSGDRGLRWDQNQDLIGQGLAKLSSALVGAFPTSSSFSRSALNL
jgi:SulP family sulfate permease